MLFNDLGLDEELPHQLAAENSLAQLPRCKVTLLTFRFWAFV